MSDAITNGRGRIRCVGEDGWWRDCGEWATGWVKTWAHWENELRWLPLCPRHQEGT